MDAGLVDQLLSRARAVVDHDNAEQLMVDIDRALHETGSDPMITGRLHLARAVTRLIGSEPQDATTDALRAVVLLRRTGRTATEAYAAAVGALLWHRAGEVDRSVDFSVQALVALAGSEPADHDALDAANTLALVFARLSAFDSAVGLAERAFSNSAALPVEVRGHYAFNLGYCAIESGVDAATDQRVLDLALEAADYLESDPDSDVARLSAAGFRGEVALLRDDRPAYDQIGPLLDRRRTGDPSVDRRTGERLLPWLRLVRGSAALRWGDPAIALDLLDVAVSDLERLGEEHRLVRALDHRANARMAVGDHQGAATDALALAAAVRGHRIRDGGRLAGHILHRADLEAATGRLDRQTDRLAPTAAIDAVTGTGTRRWLELRLDHIVRESKLLAIVMLDVDHLKRINERFGSDVGDLVLGRVGAILSEQVRSTDVLARYGGEEFVMLLTDSGIDEARDLADRVQKCVTDEPWDLLAPGLVVTASAGAVEGPSWSARDLARYVHRAIGRAKGQAQNGVTIADPDPIT